MVDTTSPLLGLLLMGTGGDNNSWGINLNNNVITPVENAIAGLTTISSTGGNYAVSADESRSAIIGVIGTLTSDLILTVPAPSKKWSIANLTSGNFAVLIKSATSASINLPRGKFIDVINNGVGTLFRLDGAQVGEYVYHAASVPGSVFECNGAALKRASYPDLFNQIGTTYGSNDATDFKLPNAYDTGRFLRSRSASVAVGTSQANQNLAHTHVASASSVTGTTDSQGTHYHTASIYDPGHTHTASTNAWLLSGGGGVQYYGGNQGATTGSVTVNAAGTGVRVNSANGIDTTNSAGAHTHNVTGTAAAQTIASSGGAEARPESLVGILCIRY